MDPVGHREGHTSSDLVVWRYRIAKNQIAETTSLGDFQQQLQLKCIAM